MAAKTFAAMLGLLLLAGCSSKSTSETSAPGGPINYALVSARLRGPPASQADVRGTMAAALGSPQSAAASGVVANFVSEASPVIGPISTVAKLVSSWRTSSKINQLTQEVALEQSEIADIEQELNLADNVFYVYVQQQAQGAALTWIGNYNDSFNAIQGVDGAYASFLGTIGLPGTGVWPASLAYASIATDTRTMNALNTVAVSNKTQYMQQLQDLSGAVVPLDCADCYRQVTAAPLASEAQVGSPTSATLQVYDALYQQLLSYVPQNNGKQATDLATVLEAYNQEITTIYQQNVVALQEAYTVEATESYLNYVAGQNGAASLEIESSEGSPSLIYSYGGGSPEAEEQSLTDAQEQLALLYAARINVLFGITMQYIVSDAPFSDYAWPPAPQFTNGPDTAFTPAQLADINAFVAAHPYSGFVKQNKPARSLVGTLGEVMPTVQSNPYLFYQYDGMNQFYACSEALIQAGVALTPATCPPLFPASTGAQWDGIEFSVYYDVAGVPTLTAPFNLVTGSAAVTDPLSLYIGTLQTGQSTGTLLATQVNGASAYQGATCPAASQIDMGGSDTDVQFTTSFGMTNVVPGSNQFWFTQKGNNVQVVNMQQYSGVVNQFTGDEGFVGAFTYAWTYKDHQLFELALACAGDNPFCWATPNGLCMGGESIVMLCNDDNDCTIASGGSCVP